MQLQIRVGVPFGSRLPGKERLSDLDNQLYKPALEVGTVLADLQRICKLKKVDAVSCHLFIDIIIAIEETGLPGVPIDRVKS
jgi:hypothetical protein